MTDEIGQGGGWGRECLHPSKPQKEEESWRCERKNERPPASEAVDHVTGALGYGWGCGKGAVCEGAMSVTVVTRSDCLLQDARTVISIQFKMLLLSELRYGWQTASRSVVVSSPAWAHDQIQISLAVSVLMPLCPPPTGRVWPLSWVTVLVSLFTIYICAHIYS